jgi:hypothetical protein
MSEHNKHSTPYKIYAFGMRVIREHQMLSLRERFARCHTSCARSKPDACTEWSGQPISWPSQGPPGLQHLYLAPVRNAPATVSRCKVYNMLEVNMVNLKSCTRPTSMLELLLPSCWKYGEFEVLYSSLYSNRINGVGK